MATSGARIKRKTNGAASNRDVGVTGSRKNSGQIGGSMDHFYEARIKELEQQVADLKKRLDELRKAKSTTIIKKDKEYVAMGAGQRASLTQGSIKSEHADCCKEHISSLQNQLDQLNSHRKKEAQQHINEIATLKESHKTELEELKQELQANAQARCNSSDGELESLRKQNRTLQEQSNKLESKVTELQLRINDLMEELSKKEAEWCSKEEKLVLELKTSWGVKYQQWMAQTEQKIEELQAANNFLRTILERQNPERK